ncbi:DUF7134 domain-containing protein [Nocardiopsis terrae]
MPLADRRPRAFDALVATVVLLVELFATYGALTGPPLAPVDGWVATRQIDPLSFALALVGCGALYWRRRLPATTLAVATLAYAAFLLRDHELGMFLAPMVALYTASALALPRMIPALATAVGLGASLWWVHTRTAGLTDPGVAMLAWIAFGAVIVLFLVGSYVAGELVRCHRELDEHEERHGNRARETTPLHA